MHENLCKSFFLSHGKENVPPQILNGVLENVMVCAHLSSKQAHGTKSLYYITLLLRLFRILYCLCPKCALWA